jgi:hypothetical protein
VKPTRSSARPTRRQARSKLSFTTSGPAPPFSSTALRAASLAVGGGGDAPRRPGSGAEAVVTLVSPPPSFTMMRESISASSSRSGRVRHPLGAVRRGGREHFLDVAVAHEDLGRARLGALLQARAELVAARVRVHAVDHAPPRCGG